MKYSLKMFYKNEVFGCGNRSRRQEQCILFAKNYTAPHILSSSRKCINPSYFPSIATSNRKHTAPNNQPFPAFKQRSLQKNMRVCRPSRKAGRRVKTKYVVWCGHMVWVAALHKLDWLTRMLSRRMRSDGASSCPVVPSLADSHVSSHCVNRFLLQALIRRLLFALPGVYLQVPVNAMVSKPYLRTGIMTTQRLFV